MFLNKAIIIIFFIIFQSFFLINEEFFVLISFFSFLFILKAFVGSSIDTSLKLECLQIFKKIELVFFVLKKQVLIIIYVLLNFINVFYLNVLNISKIFISFIKKINIKLINKYTHEFNLYVYNNFEFFLNRQIWENNKFMYKLSFLVTQNLIQNNKIKNRKKYILTSIWKI
uniref:hypothetical protein n=1 Tax=Dixoniella grisea TaxID=35153 RepID=UPI001FCCFA4A|nr:hypothetical protein MW560_mgp07 [Dixoniella grisea]UNJ18988.1 hypothetical protein [Dixoniella grisea]